MTHRLWQLVLALFLLNNFAHGSGIVRINHEGRILGPQFRVTAPTLFNTTLADSVLSTLQIFPVTSPWNEDISKRPLLVNSDAMISQIISDLASNRRTLRVFFEMNFVLIPDNQPLQPIDFFYYADQSDPSPYPIPDNLPVETWPRETGALTLPEWQRDINDEGGDRHAIIVQPGAGFLWETWLTKRNTNDAWEAANGAKFNLASNDQRPLGWTSADAAGLPMFPALIRYDECERGMVEHAMRIVVKQSRREYIYPASHYASSTPASTTNVPAMGQRLRLKQSFQIPAAWSLHEKAVLLGLKKYGAIVADNGNFFSISATPDDRWPPNAFSHLNSISITNFEVIQTTGPLEGPRSPEAPVVSAGTDFWAPLNKPVTLKGSVKTSGPPPKFRWSMPPLSGAGTIANLTNPVSTATFKAPGQYRLVLSADDSIHPVSYDAIIVMVSTNFAITATAQGSSAKLNWDYMTGGFVLEQALEFPPIQWTPVFTNFSTSTTRPMTNSSAFWRLHFLPK
jgi:hypothetical protein